MVHQSKRSKSMEIAVDFDGTCVTHEYPNIGREIGAGDVLRALRAQGHDIILFTMRGGKLLKAAIDWFAWNNVELYAINDNPTQNEWTESRKVHAHLYIDDRALGIPLVKEEGKRP